ncbi:MAG: triose-phosphate isomerase [Burkholderiales bacterium]
MRAKLTVGNWKMNGGLAANDARLAAIATGWRRASGRSIAVCVPFPYLAQARNALSGSAVGWGAQDVSAHASGAYTGEVAASMLAEFGCAYVIVGHSERRQYHGERDEVVAAKAKAALAVGVTPIACVGESLAERDAGTTESVVLRQLEAVVASLGRDLGRIVLAYEPVWAIGTGRTAAPGEAQAVHATLRARLAAAGAPSVPVLYGGSVKAANAGALYAMPDIDGGLIGGASLDAAEFLSIASA